MIAIRNLIAWHDRARAKQLPPSAVGGVPLDFRAGPPTCHDCPYTADPETVLAHMWAEHGRDRRRTERRSAA